MPFINENFAIAWKVSPILFSYIQQSYLKILLYHFSFFHTVYVLEKFICNKKISKSTLFVHSTILNYMLLQQTILAGYKYSARDVIAGKIENRCTQNRNQCHER